MSEGSFEEISRVFDSMRQAAANVRDAHPPIQEEFAEIIANLPELIDLLEFQNDEIEQVERQRDELLDRLIVTEQALQSVNEARDRAAMALAEIENARNSAK